MVIKDRIRAEPSLDGKGWAVAIGDSRWRFNRLEFAEQFAKNMSDETFAPDILEHAHEHVWEQCDPRSCKGALWQIIQGLK